MRRALLGNFAGNKENHRPRMLSRFSVLFVTKIFRLLRVGYALRKGKKKLLRGMQK